MMTMPIRPFEKNLLVDDYRNGYWNETTLGVIDGGSYHNTDNDDHPRRGDEVGVMRGGLSRDGQNKLCSLTYTTTNSETATHRSSMASSSFCNYDNLSNGSVGLLGPPNSVSDDDGCGDDVSIDWEEWKKGVDELRSSGAVGLQRLDCLDDEEGEEEDMEEDFRVDGDDLGESSSVSLAASDVVLFPLHDRRSDHGENRYLHQDEGLKVAGSEEETSSKVPSTITFYSSDDGSYSTGVHAGSGVGERDDSNDGGKGKGMNLTYTSLADLLKGSDNSDSEQNQKQQHSPTTIENESLNSVRSPPTFNSNTGDDNSTPSNQKCNTSDSSTTHTLEIPPSPLPLNRAVSSPSYSHSPRRNPDHPPRPKRITTRVRSATTITTMPTVTPSPFRRIRHDVGELIIPRRRIEGRPLTPARRGREESLGDTPFHHLPRRRLFERKERNGGGNMELQTACGTATAPIENKIGKDDDTQKIGFITILDDDDDDDNAVHNRDNKEPTTRIRLSSNNMKTEDQDGINMLLVSEVGLLVMNDPNSLDVCPSKVDRNHECACVVM